MNNARYAFIGTWGSDLHESAEGGSAASQGGIKTFEALADGGLRLLSSVSPAVNAGIVCLSRDGGHLYATDERKDLHNVEGMGGGVCSYAVGPDGSLTFLNEVSSAGAYPCYVTTEPSGRFVFVSNHGNHSDVITKAVRSADGSYTAQRFFDEGSIAMFPVREDGSLGNCCDIQVLTGSGPIPWFQWTPHPHSVAVDPSGKYLLSADKGTDSIHVFRIDFEASCLAPVHIQKTEAGSGPRHIAFHPHWNIVYVNSEQNNSVHSYWFDSDTGRMDHISRATTLAPLDSSSEAVRNETADIRVHASGTYLYVSNRGDDSIACYRLDPSGGMALLRVVKSGGQIPRAIQIDPSGQWLFALNQRSGDVMRFQIDQQSGQLTPVTQAAILNCPVTMAFL